MRFRLAAWFLAATLVVVAAPVCFAQQSPLPDAPSASMPDAPVPKIPTPAASPSSVAGFSAYESCTFPDKLAIVERTPLDAGVASRNVETSHGAMSVELEATERITFGYPQQDIFAGVRLDKLPVQNYLAQKATLIEDFNHTLAQSPQGDRNYLLPAQKRGFEIYGLDRHQLSGDLLGLYLFFDDLNRIVVTINFMNQDAATRPFQTREEYAKLRDQFLDAYTGCVRTNQGVPVTP